ncbi:MAG: hypothetical protein WDZ39_00760 [Candidatus Spechtbacterales bacterium]
MIFLDYFWWHYLIAPKQILTLLKNYSIAIWHKFLIKQHLRTLFAPWHKMQAQFLWPSQNFADKLGNFAVDVFVRTVAALIRSTIIITGLVMQVIAVAFFGALLIFWALWPLVFLMMVLRGVVLIFS